MSRFRDRLPAPAPEIIRTEYPELMLGGVVKTNERVVNCWKQGECGGREVWPQHTGATI